MELGALGRLGENGGHVTKRAEEEVKFDTACDSVTTPHRNMAAKIVAGLTGRRTAKHAF